MLKTYFLKVECVLEWLNITNLQYGLYLMLRSSILFQACFIFYFVGIVRNSILMNPFVANSVNRRTVTHQ
jgi:hypothetical protein